jgi:hypothetical protein
MFAGHRRLSGFLRRCKQRGQTGGIRLRAAEKR